MTMEELQRLQEADIMTADRVQLTDICTLEIEKHRAVKDRIQSYLEQVGNPFLVKVGDYVLKLNYADNGRDMEERMMEYVSEMTKIRCGDIAEKDAGRGTGRREVPCGEMREKDAGRETGRREASCGEVPEKKSSGSRI